MSMTDEAAALPLAPWPTCEHFPDGALPEFLCRRCHPELTITPEQARILDAAEAMRRREAEAAASRQREIKRLRERLDSLTRHCPEQGTINATVADALMKKLHRLEWEVRS